MTRPIITCYLLLSLVLCLAPAVRAVTTIPEDDMDPFTGPCSLAIAETTGGCQLSWDAVSGTSYYVVGYRTCDGVTVGLAELAGTSYEYTGHDPSACLEYVVVAYDGSGVKICSAHAFTSACPCQ
jgi:hypothetical protein